MLVSCAFIGTTQAAFRGQISGQEFTSDVFMRLTRQLPTDRSNYVIGKQLLAGCICALPPVVTVERCVSALVTTATKGTGCSSTGGRPGPR